MDTVIAAADVGVGITALVICGAGIPPSDDRVVIMRARVHDFSCGTVRQVHVRAFIAEPELQHSHTRHLQPIA